MKWNENEKENRKDSARKSSEKEMRRNGMRKKREEME